MLFGCVVCKYQLPTLESNWTGCPTSPALLSETLLVIVKLVPPYTETDASLSAAAFEDANLIVVELSLIA